MKKVLIITYYWPPASGPGVQRFLKFVKYFSHFGIKASVLTVEKGSFSSMDTTLLDDIPKEVKTYRSKALEPFALYNALRGKKGKSVEVGMGNIKNPDTLFKKFAKYVRSNFFIPDARVGWNKSAKQKAIKILKEDGISTVITTGPPHSTHLIGLHLKKNNPKIKWIADFRDPWVTIYYEKYLKRNAKSAAKNQNLETQVVSAADHVVVISQGMYDEFHTRAKSISIIPNGYDAEDLTGVVAKDDEKFTIAYTGNFKVNQNIDSFWRALVELKTEHEGFGDQVLFHMTGPVNDEIKESISKFELDSMVEYSGFVKHEEAVRRMKAASLLYLPIPQTETNKTIITGKIFEYMASFTPILSIGPLDGNAHYILQKCDRGPMCSYDDKVGIKALILEDYLFWKTNQTSRILKSDAFQQFERKELTRDYGQLI